MPAGDFMMKPDGVNVIDALPLGYPFALAVTTTVPLSTNPCR